MKEIQAIILPFMLEGLINAPHRIEGLPALTISAVHGLSVERGAFRSMAYGVAVIRKKALSQALLRDCDQLVEVP
jgi:nitrogen regulatory protein PII